MAAEVRRKQFKEETSTFSYKNNKRSHSPALSILSIPASSHSENTRTISLCQADIRITLPTVPLSQALLKAQFHGYLPVLIAVVLAVEELQF